MYAQKLSLTAKLFCKIGESYERETEENVIKDNFIVIDLYGFTDP